MSTKTISIKEEAYKRLKKLKKDDKSFSDVIMELTDRTKKDFSNLLEADLDLEWSDVKRERNKGDEERERLLSGH